MSEAHTGQVALEHTFREAYGWLAHHGPADLKTEKRGTPFQAIADVGKRGTHAGDRLLRFTSKGGEARAYGCCWGWYTNCSGTRIGMYCQALDSAVYAVGSHSTVQIQRKDDRGWGSREKQTGEAVDDLPDAKDLPRLLGRYKWDDYHAAFGWPPDCLDTGFPWIVTLEDKFRAALEQNVLPPLSLVTEMILWGGNQQNVLGKFSKGLRAKGYEAFIRKVVDSLDDPSLALQFATAIKGFGLTYGSKLLRFCRPRDYGALDSRIQTALKDELGPAPSSDRKKGKYYKEYVGLLHEYQRRLQAARVLRPEYGPRAASTEWTAAEVEMALFAWASSQSQGTR